MFSTQLLRSFSYGQPTQHSLADNRCDHDSCSHLAQVNVFLSQLGLAMAQAGCCYVKLSHVSEDGKGLEGEPQAWDHGNGHVLCELKAGSGWNPWGCHLWATSRMAWRYEGQVRILVQHGWPPLPMTRMSSPEGGLLKPSSGTMAW